MKQIITFFCSNCHTHEVWVVPAFCPLPSPPELSLFELREIEAIRWKIKGKAVTWPFNGKALYCKKCGRVAGESQAIEEGA